MPDSSEDADGLLGILVRSLQAFDSIDELCLVHSNFRSLPQTRDSQACLLRHDSKAPERLQLQLEQAGRPALFTSHEHAETELRVKNLRVRLQQL